MFDKTVLLVNANNDHGGNAAAINKLGETIAETSRNDIKARDRVDISLEEYERLRSENSRLSMEVVRLVAAFHNIGIQADVAKRIIPDTVEVSFCHNYKEFRERYRVEFDVEQWPDI